ncbi:uncharacterized protein G2W53_017502 [Senna tora]|uniref:Uncharacterized protein n=1 Tax=Senna tora TaxID=362788 RepID=A0A834WMI1_9FABA|nr:uncharacterized protein G2W53_017502 [Senna tora]
MVEAIRSRNARLYIESEATIEEIAPYLNTTYHRRVKRI